MLIMLMPYVVQVRCRLAEETTNNSHRMITARLRKRAKALLLGWSEVPMKDGFPTCCTVIPTSDTRVG